MDLQPLVAGLGKKLFVLYCGRDCRTYSAHLELARLITNADATIRGFCVLIQGLADLNVTCGMRLNYESLT